MNNETTDTSARETAQDTASDTVDTESDTLEALKTLLCEQAVATGPAEVDTDSIDIFECLEVSDLASAVAARNLYRIAIAQGVQVDELAFSYLDESQLVNCVISDDVTVRDCADATYTAEDGIEVIYAIRSLEYAGVSSGILDFEFHCTDEIWYQSVESITLVQPDDSQDWSALTVRRLQD